jgi:hypothetical protein
MLKNVAFSREAVQSRHRRATKKLPQYVDAKTKPVGTMLKADFHTFSKKLRPFWDSVKLTNEEKQNFCNIHFRVS